MKTVKEVSELTGVSVRALHHYDQIGLLHPSSVTEAGYRLYDQAALEKLHTILLFRELEFPLNEIREIINSPTFDPTEALEQQIQLLEKQYRHTGRLIALASEIQRRGKAAMGFEAFDKSEIEQYKKEARDRWGRTEAYQEYMHKQLRLSPEQSREQGEEMIRFLKEMGAMRHLPPQNGEVQKKVGELQQLFTRLFYTCTNQILAALGEMYVDNIRFRRNIDEECGEGAALFLRDAIRIYCAET